MKKEEIQTMLSQVDEKYIAEITESEINPDAEYAAEVSGEVEVVKHISHWRNWAAAAAALIVCVGLGVALVRPAIQRSQFEVADSAGCYDVLDSMSEEDFDKYFKGIPEESLTGLDLMSPVMQTENISPLGQKYFQTAKITFSSESGEPPVSKVQMDMENTESAHATIRIFDSRNSLTPEFEGLEPYHIDEYDVDFYGAYTVYDDTNPKYSSAEYFIYHNKLYALYTQDMTKKQTINLVYEILESDFSAKRLYLEYAMSEEDFIPYFINTEDNEDDILGNLNGSEAFSERYGKFTARVENVAPAVAKNHFNLIDIAFNDTSYSDRKAELQMMNSGNDNAIIRVYDNPELPEQLSQMTLYHLDDYDIDFYGIYRNQDTEMSHCLFAYHGKLYEIYTDNFSRKETVKLAYEVLESDFSAESLYQQYQFDIMSEEDFVPYFTYAKPDVSNLTYYKDDYYFDSQYGDFTLEVNNAVPPFRKNQFNTADYIWFNENSDRKARASMNNAEHGIQLTVYDNVQVDMNDFTTLSPYHLDDYDIDFYGLYKTHDTPIKCSTACVFRYHDRLYVMTATNFTRQETMKLVYEILDSDISAESLYQQYCGDIVHMEDSRIITLEAANELEFCKGKIPQLDVLNGENEKINGRNLGMNGEYIYNHLYDDSDLILYNDSLGYHQNEDGEQLSYTYSNAECYLHITYTSFLPDHVNLAEHYSPKITLQYPFSTPVDGQDENSRLRYWDFWLDLGSCYVNLDGLCSMNQEADFVNGLNNIVINQQQDAQEKQSTLASTNQMELCRNLVPQMVEVGDMRFNKTITALTESEPIKSVKLEYSDAKMTKGFTVNYSNMDLALADIAVPVITADQITEEGLENAGIFTEYQGFFIDCQQCLIDISLSNCTKEEMMPYLTELKNLIETYDSQNTDLQEFTQNQSYLWHGLIPEIQSFGNLKFAGVTDDSRPDYSASHYELLYQDEENPEHKLSVICSYDSNADSIQNAVGLKLGTLEAVPIMGGDGSLNAYELHAGLFNIQVNAYHCTWEELNLYLTEMDTLIEKNYHAADTILKALNEQEVCKNWIPDLWSLNNFYFQYAVTNLSLDENAPTIELFYQDKERNSSFSCIFMKNRDTTSVEDTDIDTLTDTWIVENIINVLDEMPVMMIDCHDYYVRVSAKNCSAEDAGNYLFDLSGNYREHH